MAFHWKNGVPLFCWLSATLIVGAVCFAYRSYLLYIVIPWALMLAGGMILVPTRTESFRAIQVGIFTGLSIGLMLAMGSAL